MLSCIGDAGATSEWTAIAVTTLVAGNAVASQYIWARVHTHLKSELYKADWQSLHHTRGFVTKTHLMVTYPVCLRDLKDHAWSTCHGFYLLNLKSTTQCKRTHLMSEMIPAYLFLDRLTHLATQLQLALRFYFILRQWHKLWGESRREVLVLWTHIGPSYYLKQGYLSYVPRVLSSLIKQWSECDWCRVKAWREGCVGHSWILWLLA